MESPLSRHLVAQICQYNTGDRTIFAPGKRNPKEGKVFGISQKKMDALTALPTFFCNIGMSCGGDVFYDDCVYGIVSGVVGRCIHFLIGTLVVAISL